MFYNFLDFFSDLGEFLFSWFIYYDTIEPNNEDLLEDK